MRDRMSEIFSLTSGNGCFKSPLFSYHVTKKRQALGTRMRKRKLKELTHRARSIQPKFPEISVQNSMDQFGPTGKVLKKLVHLLRWTTFPGPTGWKFWLNGSHPYRCKIYHNYSKWCFNINQIWADFLEDEFLVRHIQEMGHLSLCSLVLKNLRK